MSRNRDATEAATKPQSCRRSTLESDCCNSSRPESGVGGGGVVGSDLRIYDPNFAAADRTVKDASSLREEIYDSGVITLFSSETIDDDDKTISSHDRNGRSTIGEQSRIVCGKRDSPSLRLQDITRVEEELAELRLGRCGDSSPPADDDGQSARNDVDAAGEDLFNWDVVFQQDQDGDTQLHVAVLLDMQLAFALSVINLCLNTELLDLQNHLLQTVLHLAVIMHRTQIIQALVSRGAALFMCDLDGNTPLHLACQIGYKDAVHILTQKYQAQSEKHALQRIIHHRNFEGLTCCHLSAKSSAPDNLFHLIEDCGADINVKEGKRGMTVLHMAAESNNLILVAFLVNCPRINLNQLTYDGWTALDLAMGRRLEEMEGKLYKAGGWHSEENEAFSSDSPSDEEIFEEDIDDLEIF